LIFTVAIPTPLRRLFDYLPPASPGQAGEKTAATIAPGTRVRVPFGRRSLVGIVTGSKTVSHQPEAKLRAIEQVLDASPLVEPQLLALFIWAANYYRHPVGDALFTTLPSLLRQGEAVPDNCREHWRLSSRGLGLGELSLGRAPRQRQLIDILSTQGPQTGAALANWGISRDIVKTLAAKGLVEAVSLPLPTPVVAGPLLAQPHLALRDEQRQALDSLEMDAFHSYLLFGDTGTGKTEVYLQAIEKVLNRGRQALVLVPEINLTPQTLERFRHRFNCPITLMHSGLSDRERLQAWTDARDGRARIVIGTRSAVFTPLAAPGIIILDEEHDPSFKQQEGFRYSARDVAVMRASRTGIPVILGSATPSLESLNNCQRGRYQLLELRDRGHHSPAPAWELVDLRGTELKAGFSAPLLKAMATELDKGGQVLVFLNRRGYAPLLLCHDCGWQAECRHCSARLTVHLQRKSLICHHCEGRQALPHRCQGCHSQRLEFVGQGTERSEEVLGELFPDVPVLRIDRDSTRRKHGMRDALAAIHKNQPCILVGTQMIAKGHHFPAVTLAVLLEADSGLFSTDFRATERMAQMITQVAGRAGRGDRPGRVIIQSHYCDHPLLTELIKGDYRHFANLLLAERHQQQLPPFTNLALFRADAREARQAEQFLNSVRQLCEQLLPPSPGVQYLGPLPGVMEKRKGMYRFTLLVNAVNRAHLADITEKVCAELDRRGTPNSVSWSLDVDPADLN